MGSRGVGQSLRVGFMNFHDAWLSGLSGGPSACEFRGNYLQTKNAERTERRSRGSWRKTRNHFPARFNEKTREKKHTQNKRERNVNNAYHSDERQLSNITPQLEPQHKRGYETVEGVETNTLGCFMQTLRLSKDAVRSAASIREQEVAYRHTHTL